MLRNDLITLLGEKKANRPVAVSINGFMIEVEDVADVGETIVLVLDPDEMRDTLKQLADGDLGPGAIPAE